jgi:hypothetical protein
MMKVVYRAIALIASRMVAWAFEKYFKADYTPTDASYFNCINIWISDKQIWAENISKDHKIEPK